MNNNKMFHEANYCLSLIRIFTSVLKIGIDASLVLSQRNTQHTTGLQMYKTGYEIKRFYPQETANTVLEIFSKAEPGQLPYVVSSSFMKNASPACARAHLEQLELSGAPSVTVTLCKAAQALRIGDLHYYQQQMDRHAEVGFSRLSSTRGALFKLLFCLDLLRNFVLCDLNLVY